MTQQFVPVDGSRVTGIQLVSQNWEARTADDGETLLNADDQPVAEGEEPAVDPVPSRETIYVDEIFFSRTPDAPRSVPEAPEHDQADVLGLYGAEYSSAAVVDMDGSLTIAGAVSTETIAGNEVMKYADVEGIQITAQSPIRSRCHPDAPRRRSHFSIWRSPTDVAADLTIALRKQPVWRGDYRRSDHRGLCPALAVGGRQRPDHGRSSVRR